LCPAKVIINAKQEKILMTMCGIAIVASSHIMTAIKIIIMALWNQQVGARLAALTEMEINNKNFGLQYERIDFYGTKEKLRRKIYSVPVRTPYRPNINCPRCGAKAVAARGN
jgi:hypothetical protein